MTIVLIVVAVVILIIATFKYPPISLAFFLTAAFIKATLMLKYGFFRVVDYTVLCAVLMLLAIAYSFLKNPGRLRDIISLPLIAYLLLAAVLFLGMGYTSAPSYGFEKSSRFATLGLIAFLAPIIFAHSLKEVKLMIWILLAVGIILASGTIIAPGAAVLRAAAETRGSFLEANPLGTALNMGVASIITFIFAIMAHTSKRLRIASLAVIVLMMVGILTTGSRGPFLGLLFTWMVAVFICHRGTSKTWLLFIIGGIAIAMVISFISMPEKGATRVSTVWKSGYHVKEALYERTEMFTWTVKRIPERLILGHGTGAFAVDRGGPDVRYYPHNIILESLYEQGLVGAVILSLFLWLIFRRWWQASKLVRLYELDIGIFQAVHIAGLLFLFTLIQAMKSGDIEWNRFMFFCAGLVVAAFSLVRHMAEEISLGGELTAEVGQHLEGFESQDMQLLY